MDEQRFDSWTRAYAQPGSRRRLLRALVGGAALLTAARRSLSDTRAHHGSAGPGEACRTDDQCVAADAPMVCAWNGYGSAGVACCTYEGSNCADDSWCCGANLCIGGICSSQSSGCTGQGCGCTSDGDCDAGLMCCVQGDPGAPGTCQTLDACPGSLCTSEGCSCTTGTFSPCADGLQCCAMYPGMAGGPGVCQWSC